MNTDGHIVAIGGGGFGRNPNEAIIENYILNLSDSKKPNITFFPTASAENSDYIVNFYTAFSNLNCNAKHISLFKNTPNLESIVNESDIIYIGGGNTKSMLSVWREWGLHNILKVGYDNGIVMSGVSAGAICWFNQGITDSWADQLNIIDCLGFIEGNCCPHYDEESERRPSLIKFLEQQKLKDCYAIEGGCALHIKNDNVYSAVSFQGSKKSYLVDLKDGEIRENICSTIKIP